MKIKKLALVLMFTPVLAFAGKAEREFVTNEVNPAVQEAIASYKSSCGCDLEFDIKLDTFKDISEMKTIRSFAKRITEGAKSYCTDQATKDVMCELKTIEFSVSSKATFEFKDGKGIATADNQSASPSWEMVTGAVDK